MSQAAALTDPELVALTAAGDSHAYGELYERHLQAAMRRARQLAKSLPDAEDLVASAFTSVLSAIRRGKRPDQFRAYLFTAIFTHACGLTQLRQRCGVVNLVEGLDANWLWIRPLTADTDPAVIWTVRQAFRSLPARWRIALWLTAVEGRQPAELATLLHTTPNAAAALSSRARHGLLLALDPHPPLHEHAGTATKPRTRHNPERLARRFPRQASRKQSNICSI